MCGARLIPINKSMYGRYLKRDSRVACVKCDHKFKVGDKAVSKHRGSSRTQRIRILLCRDCADKMSIGYSLE